MTCWSANPGRTALQSEACRRRSWADDVESPRVTAAADDQRCTPHSAHRLVGLLRCFLVSYRLTAYFRVFHLVSSSLHRRVLARLSAWIERLFFFFIFFLFFFDLFVSLHVMLRYPRCVTLTCMVIRSAVIVVCQKNTVGVVCLLASPHGRTYTAAVYCREDDCSRTSRHASMSSTAPGGEFLLLTQLLFTFVSAQ